MLCACVKECRRSAGNLEAAHALLDAAPVDDGPGLEEAELAAEAPALLFEADYGGLADNDAVDGIDGRDAGSGVGAPVAVAAGPRRRRSRGRTAERSAEPLGREARGDGLEARSLHLGGYVWVGMGDLLVVGGLCFAGRRWWWCCCWSVLATRLGRGTSDERRESEAIGSAWTERWVGGWMDGYISKKETKDVGTGTRLFYGMQRQDDGLQGVYCWCADEARDSE